MKCRKGSTNANATTAQESRKLLKFVNAKLSDVFYDLGCGFATPCIIASQDYNMKKVVGIESCEANFLEATKRLMKKKMTEKIWLWNEDYQKIDIKDATIVYCLLELNFSDVEYFSKILRKKCRILTVEPIPSIIPSKMMKIAKDEFYLTKGPLKKHIAKNPDSWARSIPQKKFRSFEDYCIEYKTKFSNADTRELKKLMKKIYQ